MTFEQRYQRSETAIHVDIFGRTFQAEEIASAIVLNRNVLSVFKKQQEGWLGRAKRWKCEAKKLLEGQSL